MKPHSEVHEPAASAAHRVVLLVDADWTLAPLDTGRAVGDLLGDRLGINSRIKATFQQHGYTRRAFEEVALLWSDVPLSAFARACETVADWVHIRSAWLQVFEALPASVHVVVVTAGLPLVWRRVLDRHGYGEIPLVGGCHASVDDYFVTADCKAALVSRYQRTGAWVVMAGDSDIDGPATDRADLAVLVAKASGSASLRRRLATHRNALHLATDARRFPPLATCSARQLVSILAQRTGVAEPRSADPRSADPRSADPRSAGADHLPLNTNIAS